VQRQERVRERKGEGIVGESEEVGKGEVGGMDQNKTTAKKRVGPLPIKNSFLEG
jgi:hypothetical protein